MSEEQLKAFLEKVKSDTELQEKFKAAPDVDTAAGIAKAAGFMISENSFHSLLNSIKVSSGDDESTELSLDQLKSVAGGMSLSAMMKSMGLFDGMASDLAKGGGSSTSLKGKKKK